MVEVEPVVMLPAAFVEPARIVGLVPHVPTLGVVAVSFRLPPSVIQLVPSDCNTTHCPAIAGKIAVPAVAEPIGTTFDDALFTACAEMLLIWIQRPADVDAAGRVSVNVPEALMITDGSSAPAVAEVPVLVTGAGVAIGPPKVSCIEAAASVPEIRCVVPLFAQTRKVLLVPDAGVVQVLTVPRIRLLAPVVSVVEATCGPMMTLLVPPRIEAPAWKPSAVLAAPVDNSSAFDPTAVALFPVCAASALVPTAVAFCPPEMAVRALAPIPTLLEPAASESSALTPMPVLLVPLSEVLPAEVPIKVLVAPVMPVTHSAPKSTKLSLESHFAQLSVAGVPDMVAIVEVTAGKVRVFEPATAGAIRPTEPEVEPAIETRPVTPTAPTVSVGEDHVRFAEPPNAPALLNCTEVVGDAGAPPAAMLLQPKPPEVVHVSALVAALHDGIARSVGAAAEPVALPFTVLAVMLASDIVPAPTMGDGEALKPVPAATEVTVPAPPPPVTVVQAVPFQYSRAPSVVL